MHNHKAGLVISQLRQRWVTKAILTNLLIALATALVAITLWFKLVSPSLVSALIIVLVSCGATLFIKQEWKLTNFDVARYLNRKIPALEESALLLLAPDTELNYLQRMQVSKLSHGITTAEVQDPVTGKMRVAMYVLLAAVVLSFILYKIDFSSTSFKHITRADEKSTGVLPEKVLPQISSVRVTITPPAYTGQSAQSQSRFNIIAAENAVVNWVIQTNLPMKKVGIRLNDKAVLYCRSVNNNPKQWMLQMQVKEPGFYQVMIDTIVSERYRIEMIKDKPPTIVVATPKTGTVIRSGQPKVVDVAASLTDDYGVRQATMFATIASGNGEAVKFKEQQIALAGFRNGSKQSQIQQRINLGALGMSPGDELYFYIQASDDNQQQVRSDVIIVSLEDTSELMSMDGLVLGLDLKPEFFRSQRQIIIETEQLLRERDTISVHTFNNKSNDLGIDQQLLRLRYGKFLGEESNTEIAGGHDHEDEAGHEEEGSSFGNANDILDQFSHKHDIAEDATFFDPETKKQLKATLAEMWKAEGKLRLNKPAEALPFEYNALRLLKDLQQKSRAYVAKTSSKLPVLKPSEKRLTGELDKIGQPVLQSDIVDNRQGIQVLRQALGVLEIMKQTPATSSSLNVLQQAGNVIGEYASADPSKYLAGIEAYHRIMNDKYRPADVLLVQKALQSILKSPDNLPAKKSKTPVSVLSKEYFKNLQNKGR